MHDKYLDWRLEQAWTDLDKVSRLEMQAKPNRFTNLQLWSISHSPSYREYQSQMLRRKKLVLFPSGVTYQL